MTIKRENYQTLLKYVKLLPEQSDKKIKHNFREYAYLLPFPTREPERATFLTGIEPVLGEFVRKISGVDGVALYTDQEQIVSKLISIVDIQEEDIPYFKELFNNYLEKENNQLKIFHPYAYHFLSLSEGNSSKGEQLIGKFIHDIFRDGSEIKEFFTKNDVDDLLSKLILDNLGELTPKEEKVTFHTKLPHISKMFREDFNVLIRNKESFTKKFPLFLAYYYFFYITQLILKINQGFKARLDEITPIYWFLDFEPSSKDRKGYKEGYSMISHEKNSLLPHINTLAHLNILAGSTDSLLYNELEEYIEGSNQMYVMNEMLKDWIKRYRRETMQSDIEDLPDEFQSLVKILRESIYQGIDQAPMTRYIKSVETIGKKYFLKRRIGYALNATQELILLMTSFAIKEDHMPLNDVFEFLESRGLYFDRYSKEEIVAMFDRLNLMDKKSDSGDAQYVKSIL